MRAVLLIAGLIASVNVIPAQNAEEVLSQGIEKFQQGEYTAALGSFQEAVRLSPADARAIAYLAITRATLGDCGHSVNELMMQSRRISDPVIRRLAGLGAVQCLLARNDIPELLPILANLLRDHPNDPDVLYQAAKVYTKAWNVAVKDMLERNGSSYRTDQLSAEVLETQGKYAEAVSAYRKAIEKNPKALGLHFRLGRAMVLQSQAPQVLEDARKEFEAELTLNPQDPASEYELGQVLVTAKQPDEAAAHFEKALNLAPGFPDCLVALAKLRESARKYDEAIKLLQHAIQIAPAMQSAHATLVEVYRHAGKKKDAEREQAELEKLQKPGGRTLSTQ